MVQEMSKFGSFDDSGFLDVANLYLNEPDLEACVCQ